MEFDWTTFALEAVNFLVLVWLLKRFFYRPVLSVIEARRAETATTIASAQATQREAEALKAEYQGRLAKAEEVRAATQARLDEEIAGERVRRRTALDAELALERKRRETIAAQERSEREAVLERQAVRIGARFATRLLDQLAGPELHARLADFALSELDSQATSRQEALRAALAEPGGSVTVVSAYRLDEARRAGFARSLGALAGHTLTPEFTEDAALKAGVCIMAGSWVLMANLRDELAFFSETFQRGA